MRSGQGSSSYGGGGDPQGRGAAASLELTQGQPSDASLIGLGRMRCGFWWGGTGVSPVGVRGWVWGRKDSDYPSRPSAQVDVIKGAGSGRVT